MSVKHGDEELSPTELAANDPGVGGGGVGDDGVGDDSGGSQICVAVEPNGLVHLDEDCPLAAHFVTRELGQLTRTSVGAAEISESVRCGCASRWFGESAGFDVRARALSEAFVRRVGTHVLDDKTREAGDKDRFVGKREPSGVDAAWTELAWLEIERRDRDSRWPDSAVGGGAGALAHQREARALEAVLTTNRALISARESERDLLRRMVAGHLVAPGRRSLENQRSLRAFVIEASEACHPISEQIGSDQAAGVTSSILEAEAAGCRWSQEAQEVTTRRIATARRLSVLETRVWVCELRRFWLTLLEMAAEAAERRVDSCPDQLVVLHDWRAALGTEVSTLGPIVGRYGVLDLDDSVPGALVVPGPVAMSIVGAVDRIIGPWGVNAHAQRPGGSGKIMSSRGVWFGSVPSGVDPRPLARLTYRLWDERRDRSDTVELMAEPVAALDAGLAILAPDFLNQGTS